MNRHLNATVSFVLLMTLHCLVWPGLARAQTSTSVDAQRVDTGIQERVEKISREIEKIRGLEFKKDVKAENQSQEDFGKFLDAELAESDLGDPSKQYGKVIKKLGLYRGPEIEDLGGMAKSLMQSQAGAYYDPKTETFYVLMSEGPEMMIGPLYAHELYHGLQDQHFDLDAYLLSQADGDMNDDELLARQSVVEGEATLVMMLWAFQSQLGSIPDPALLEMPIRMQSEMSLDQLKQMMKMELEMGGMPEDMRAAVEAMDDVPDFMLETLVGAYLKGMGFVFEIWKQGWPKVEELYGERPPLSSEHILHPEKWLSYETPYAIEWPSFEDSPALEGWELLEENVAGEIIWRVIFAEHELDAMGKSAAQGWDGDAYAVLKREDSDDLLLLVYSSWDSEEEAAEFAAAYQDLLKIKYADVEEATKIVLDGKDVLIVEGGAADALDDKLEFIRQSKKVKASHGARD